MESVLKEKFHFWLYVFCYYLKFSHKKHVFMYCFRSKEEERQKWEKEGSREEIIHS